VRFKFRLLHRTVDDEVKLYIVLAVGTYDCDPSLVRLHVVSEDRDRAEVTMSRREYEALPCAEFALVGRAGDRARQKPAS
jgi:hypothetical protein